MKAYLWRTASSALAGTVVAAALGGFLAFAAAFVAFFLAFAAIGAASLAIRAVARRGRAWYDELQSRAAFLRRRAAWRSSDAPIAFAPAVLPATRPHAAS